MSVGIRIGRGLYLSVDARTRREAMEALARAHLEPEVDR